MKDNVGYFEIVDREHPLGKVWFSIPEDNERIVKPKRTAEIVFRIKLWAKDRFSENIPWDNILIPENQLKDGYTDIQDLNDKYATNLRYPLDIALYHLLGLFASAFDTKYFDINLEKNKNNPDCVESILCNTPEYRALISSRYILIDDAQNPSEHRYIDGEHLIMIGRDYGFLGEDLSFNLSRRPETLKNQGLINNILNELLKESPKIKKDHAAECIQDELNKTYGVTLSATNINRNYLIGFKKIKAQFQEKK